MFQVDPKKKKVILRVSCGALKELSHIVLRVENCSMRSTKTTSTREVSVTFWDRDLDTLVSVDVVRNI